MGCVLGIGERWTGETAGDGEDSVGDTDADDPVFVPVALLALPPRRELRRSRPGDEPLLAVVVLVVAVAEGDKSTLHCTTGGPASCFNKCALRAGDIGTFPT